MISDHIIVSELITSAWKPLSQIPIILVATLIWLTASHWIWKKINREENQSVTHRPQAIIYFIIFFLIFVYSNIMHVTLFEMINDKENILFNSLIDIAVKMSAIIISVIIVKKLNLFFSKTQASTLRIFLVALVGFALLYFIIYFAHIVNKDLLNNEFDEHPMIVKLSESTLDKNIFWLLALSTVIITPIYEEIVFRGFLQPATTTALGIHYGIVCQCLLFTLLHPKHTYLPIFIFALALSYTRQWSKSLWPGIMMHILLNGSTIATLYIQNYGNPFAL